MAKDLRQLSSSGPHPSRSLRQREPDVIELFVTSVSQDRTVFLTIFKREHPETHSETCEHTLRHGTTMMQKPDVVIFIVSKAN